VKLVAAGRPGQKGPAQIIGAPVMDPAAVTKTHGPLFLGEAKPVLARIGPKVEKQSFGHRHLEAILLKKSKSERAPLRLPSGRRRVKHSRDPHAAPVSRKDPDQAISDLELFGAETRTAESGSATVPESESTRPFLEKPFASIVTWPEPGSVLAVRWRTM
jgi:hypothetical protein